MKQNTLDRFLIWVDEDIVALTTPIVLVALGISRVVGIDNIGDVPALTWCAYVFLAVIKRYWYKHRSKKEGFQYFFLEPNALSLKLFRSRLQVQGGINRCWRIHVNRTAMKGDIKGIIRSMRNDMSQLDNQEWDSGVMLIGSTYAGLGSAQMKLLTSQSFEVQEFNYPLFRHYEWFVGRKKMIKDQEHMLGKIYTVPQEVVWRTITFSKQ
ncbi:hypothetical protein [Paenibacillus sp. 1A_MP2]|uniref:hypothetical protein n=1 Tax=Paenibacillus sp. 1A_MP2 TaxID=3457495 RepID=UPI003FCD308E